MGCLTCGDHTSNSGGTSNCNNCSTCKPCQSTATICHFVVATLEEARQYKNSYVVVQDEGNAVYHVDSTGNPLSVSRSVIYDPGHVPVVGAQINSIVMDTTGLVGYYYSPAGAVFKWDMVAV